MIAPPLYPVRLAARLARLVFVLRRGHDERPAEQLGPLCLDCGLPERPWRSVTACRCPGGFRDLEVRP